jgi:hypothetical protein
MPVLSPYGGSFSKIFHTSIRRYIYGKRGGSLSFPRMIKLKPGENKITVKVIDHKGIMWEESVQVIKKVRQIHAPDERWRITIHLESHNQSAKEDNEKDNEEDNEKKKSITHKLNKAFYSQKRFWVVDIANLEKIIEEKNLSYYIDMPHLGIREHRKIMVDVFLLVHIQESLDSCTFLASLVDFETGEILATKEVFEEIEPQAPSGFTWDEEPREHIYQNCCVLAAKFKEHFPICEGNIISLIKEEIETDICKDDGLREKMKLIIYKDQNYKDQNQEDDFTVIAEAKVTAVRERYSLATLLGKLVTSNANENETNWKVITK